MIAHNRKPLIMSIVLGLCTLSSFALSDVEEITLGASSVWSSWYWPRMDSLNPNMYDSGECMHRYDQYDIPSGQGAQTWEADPDNHGHYPEVEAWQGHCHAWAAASIWEKQPVVAETHSGVQFHIRDKKGLLTELYIKVLQQGHYGFIVDYPTPGQIWRLLRKDFSATGGVRKPVIMDLSPNSDEEWNYPVFRYKVDYNGVSPNISGNMWFYYAQDNSPALLDDTVTQWAISQAYSFSGVSFDSFGEPVPESGRWTGTRLPGRIWRSKSILEACSQLGKAEWTCMSGNPHLEAEYLKVILGECTASEVFVDRAANVPGTGTLVRPFKTVTEGVAEVCTGGKLNVVSGVYSEKITINKKMTIKNVGGPVAIRYSP